MKRITFIVATAVVCSLPISAAAQSGNSSVQAFGGLTFGGSDFMDTSTGSNVGGALHLGVTPNLQIIGEGGRMSDVSPAVYDLLDLTPYGVGISAWYAQGGVRLIASPTATVRPYGEATAGVARLRTDVSGLGGTPGAILDAASPFLDRAEPMYGLGAGVMMGAGPVAVDVGYRYRRIHTSGLSSWLNAGNVLAVNEVRFGVGVRF